VEFESVAGLVPAVLVTLDRGESVYCENGIMLYKDTPVTVGRKTIPSSGLLKTMERTTFGGIPYFLTEFTGPGSVAFSRDGVGEVRILELAQGQEVDVAEGSMLCADASIVYDMTYVKGTHRPGRMVGFWMDRLRGPGKVALHAHGNVISMGLDRGEMIATDFGGLLYKDWSVEAKTANQAFGGGLLGKLESFEVVELTGPGKVAIQTVDPKEPHY
jgi:uncharacterized protein (AIM24 family)